MDLAALQAKAAATVAQATRVMPGRKLLIDGDAMCYYCALGSESTPDAARAAFAERIRTAIALSGCEQALLLVTAHGSNKGHRYALARTLPYQGKRSGKERPKNWQMLRDMLDTDHLMGCEVVSTAKAEADDLFAFFSSHLGWENVVLFYQDKDMRMVPGLHMHWQDYTLLSLPPDTWYTTHLGKVYGRAWFWSQMMHGDTVDNIPGLPWYKDGSIVKSGPNKGQEKVTKVGDQWAGLAELPGLRNDRAAGQWCLGYYMMGYPSRAEAMLAMAEQGTLLWMRAQPTDWAHVFKPGSPLYYLALHPDGEAAIQVLAERVAEADRINEGASCND